MNNDQEVADLTAFILCLSGSDLPVATGSNILEPPGPPSQDVPASVGTQITAAGPLSADDSTTLTTLYTLANAGKVGLVVKGRVDGVSRGYSYQGSGAWQSDRSGQVLTSAELAALAAPGSEITYTVVPKGSEVRVGIDHDLDGCLDGDEGVVCQCPSDFDGNSIVNGLDADAFFEAFDTGAPAADPVEVFAWTGGKRGRSTTQYNPVENTWHEGEPMEYPGLEMIFVKFSNGVLGRVSVDFECIQSYAFPVRIFGRTSTTAGITSPAFSITTVSPTRTSNLSIWSKL